MGHERPECACSDVSCPLPGVNAADVVGVDHENVGSAVIGDRAERFVTVIVFAVCDRYIRSVNELRVALHVPVIDWVFQPVNVLRFKMTCTFHGTRDVPALVNVHHDRDVVANSIPHHTGALSFVRHACLRPTTEFHRGEAAFNQFSGRLVQRVEIVVAPQPTAGVCGHGFGMCASEQLPYRLPERLPRDVPDSEVNHSPHVMRHAGTGT